MTQITLPNSALYNLIPLEEADQVRRFMLEAITVSHEEGAYGRFMGYAYTGCAVTLSLVHGVGFYLRSHVRLINAILYITSTDQPQLFNSFIQDLSSACTCLIFTAAATAYVFASLFAPTYFSFKDQIPQPQPPPAIPPSQPLVVHGRANPPTTALWVWISFPNGTKFEVNIGSPYVQEAIRALLGNTSTLIPNPNGVVPVVRQATLEAILANLRNPPLEAQEEDLSSSWVIPSGEEILEAAHAALDLKGISWTERLHRLFLRQEHMTKKMKYREFLKQMGEMLKVLLNIPYTQPQIERMPKDSTLKAAALKLCQALYEPSSDEKNRYQTMVDALREAWASPEYHSQTAQYPQAKELFQKAFLVHYTLDFGEFFDELVTFASGPLPVELTLANAWDVFHFKNTLSHQLDPANGGIATIDQYAQMLEGELGIAFDPSRDTNTPNRNAILITPKGPIYLLRHSTPICQSGSGVVARTIAKLLGYTNGILTSMSDQDTSVTNDFLGFIASAAAAKERILHIVLESKDKPQETSRWRARVALEGEFFFPLAFAMDGVFFNGKGKFGNIQTFTQLQGALISQLLDKNGSFYLSPKIAPDQETLNALFTEVHKLFFGSRDKILRSAECDEYKTYLLFCYVYLTLHLMQTQNIRYLDGGCKDFLDRGGVFAAVLSIFTLILTDKENDPAALKAVLNNLLAPPLMVKKKGVLTERAELFKYALGLLNRTDLGPFKQGRFKRWLQEFRVPLIKDQGILPSGTTATTQQEYDQFIERLQRLHDGELELLSLKQNLLGELALMKQPAVLRQVNRDKAHVFLAGAKDPITSAEELKKNLEEAGIQDSLRVLSGCHQGIADTLFRELQRRFNNDGLHIQLLPDSSKRDNFKISVRVRKESGVSVASIHMEQIYQLVHTNGVADTRPAQKVVGTTTIFDHRDGHAEIHCGVLPCGE